MKKGIKIINVARALRFTHRSKSLGRGLMAHAP